MPKDNLHVQHNERPGEEKSGAAPCSTENTAPTAPDNDHSAAVTRDSVSFNVLRNALYQTARLQHYSRLHRLVMFLVVLTGTAGVSTVVEKAVGAQALGFATALLAALDLLFDFRGKADLHSRMRQKYYELLADIERSQSDSERSVRDWYAKMISYTAEEPGEYRAADALAFNEAVDALGRDKTERISLPLTTRMFAHWVTFRGRDFAS